MYTKSLLDDFAFVQPEGFPREIPNAQAWIAPPVVGDMADAPQIYVWSGKITSKQETMAGQSAATINTTGPFTVMTYEMGIFIKYAMPNDLPLEDSIFTIMVDSIMEKLRGAPSTIPLIDTVVNGKPSNITHFGKDMDVWFGNIHEAEDTRYWVYECEIRNTIREAVQQ